ncbi:hypothetical protein A1Q1_03371 [Trichosporon asahii var. asahii CBS 2479]|uniref:Uncharacterized protein n=1 Tax=Trichosporon asahii var. asahii (strain ATCC 90039 / CBS 2479 / JCM 2466 / KCTC 7840 / NBRC 103889/ NCYC 2677 / UAMH 7654) TaxID=1186058 RepID=J6F697_TRIAS|nr:hypothetical protein A1Q1_03371 [Trichosporon asahii var. asahii CBS 2479]EJT52569.1 hypothetical protein A1Q1_03371 [Trichosporon asahii var. asahii CBS 2479]
MLRSSPVAGSGSFPESESEETDPLSLSLAITDLTPYVFPRDPGSPNRNRNNTLSLLPFPTPTFHFAQVRTPQLCRITQHYHPAGTPSTPSQAQLFSETTFVLHHPLINNQIACPHSQPPSDPSVHPYFTQTTSPLSTAAPRVLLLCLPLLLHNLTPSPLNHSWQKRSTSFSDQGTAASPAAPVASSATSSGQYCGYGPEKPPNPRKRRRKPVITPVSQQSMNVAGPSHAGHPTPTMVAGMEMVSPATSASGPSTVGVGSRLPFDPNEGGQIDWISTQTQKRLMVDPDEMLTFRHYIEHSDDLIAFNEKSSTFNPWVTIHAPLVFQNLPGVSRTTDALRTAVLAVGAVRLRFVDDPTNQKAASKVARQAHLKIMSLLEPILNNPNDHLEEIETTLAALLSVLVACTLAADNIWEEIMKISVKYINNLGGAAKLITNLKPQQNMLSVTRFALEQLAVRDIVACMTLGRRPSIIRQAFEPWFFEIERWSGRDVEWESVERMFGVSRSMVDVIARACSLIGISREAMVAPMPENTPRGLQDAANGLLTELQVWDHGFSYSPYHTRTQYGNHCYRHAMRIALMRDVMGLDRMDERVVSSASAIVELARELNFARGPTMNCEYAATPTTAGSQVYVGGDMGAPAPPPTAPPYASPYAQAPHPQVYGEPPSAVPRMPQPPQAVSSFQSGFHGFAPPSSALWV